MKEKKGVLLKRQLRQILQTKAAKESNLQRLGMYYTTYLGLLKCIWNENFDIGFFAFSENLVFSDYKNTNLAEKFELEVC